MERDETIFDCAKREVLEETGLKITLKDRIAYIQDVQYSDLRLCKILIPVEEFSGSVSITNRQDGEDHLIEAKFIERSDLATLTVSPEILKDEFWEDLEKGFPRTRYLGLTQVRRSNENL